MKIYGIILAGGESSRMGSPKPLLEIGGKTFAELIAEKLRHCGISSTYIVLGAHFQKIKKSLNATDLNIIINPQWEEGQLSSLKAAIRKIPADASGIIVCLIDHPMVKVKTIGRLIDIFKKATPHGVIPVFSGRGGHPVIFAREVFSALLKAPLKRGARAVTGDTSYSFFRVDVEDPYILQDIDTPGDYKNIGK